MKKRALQDLALIAALAIATVPVFGRTDAVATRDLSDQVRHELVTLPYYNVFDDLSYSVDNVTGVVTLSGAVTQPVLKGDAERNVKHLPGVTQVINDIR